MNKIIASIFFTIFTFSTFSQNKKEQIEALNFSLDSLKQQVDQKEQKISIQNGSISRNLLEIDSVKSISKNQKILIDLQLVTIQEQKKANLATLSKLEILNKSIDSLNGIIFNLDNVTIGKQIWKKENLKISTFKNGDLISEAKYPKQWEDFCASKTPCFMRLPNSEFLYNGYALEDKRGICPVGYSIPKNDDFVKLIDFLSRNTKTKKLAVQQMLTYDWWEETEDYEEGGITDTTYHSNNHSGFNGRPAGFINPTGKLSNNLNEGDLNSTEDYTNIASFGNCSYYWTSTKTNPSDDEGRSYTCEEEVKETYNGIDFGYCSQDEGGVIDDHEIRFIEYCSSFGFSIRLIKQ
jgi:uncharacterized protein (TIGR02145 family)